MNQTDQTASEPIALSTGQSSPQPAPRPADRQNHTQGQAQSHTQGHTQDHAKARTSDHPWGVPRVTPWWDSSLPHNERVDWLIANMSIDEKLGFLATITPDLLRFGIARCCIGSEAAHGIEARRDQGSHPADSEITTSLPQPIGMSATWDPALLERAGEAVGVEARVLYHRHPEGGLFRWAPTVDLERDSRWGRNAEGYGEDPLLTEGACAHEGEVAGKLGLRGWPRAAEESIVARDMLLTRDYGGRLHLCHLSTTASADLVKWGKEQGINVTAEVTPHHLLLTDDLLVNYEGIYKVNPPLREKKDTQSLRHALLDGTIDVVATDHAPHAAEDKCVEIQNARPGMLGLETSLAIVAEIFVRSGLADWRFVAKVMSERPAEIVRLKDQGRPIAVGEPANLTIVDPDHTWIARGEEMASKASNTPYEGMEFHSRVTHTILRGKVTHNLATVEGSSK